jgi:hypothetical protein
MGTLLQRGQAQMGNQVPGPQPGQQPHHQPGRERTWVAFQAGPADCSPRERGRAGSRAAGVAAAHSETPSANGPGSARGQTRRARTLPTTGIPRESPPSRWFTKRPASRRSQASSRCMWLSGTENAINCVSNAARGRTWSKTMAAIRLESPSLAAMTRSCFRRAVTCQAIE